MEYTQNLPNLDYFQLLAMSDKGSVFQKGGGGTNFEQYVQSAFVVMLAVKGNAPCLPQNEVLEVALQTTNRGWETDDLLVIAKSNQGTHQILIQAKHNLTFSEKDKIFNEVMVAFWKDYNNTKFSKTNDRLVIAKSRLNNLDKNHVKGVLDFAKSHATAVDFVSEVNRIKEKKERLELFRTVLKTANNDVALSDDEIWNFLKKLDILGYDFLGNGSIDETYILNLIKTSRAATSTANEADIWNNILAFVTKLNPNGGSVTIESIKAESFYSHFDVAKLTGFYNSIKKLKDDSSIILSPLKNTIGEIGSELHLDRTSINDDLITSINERQITIVTGKPGVGKSAIIKEVIYGSLTNSSVFIFRADQFNQPHLANTLTLQGINENLVDLFSCISLINDKIIVIDSLEKLLEDIDPDNAFKQLLSLLEKHPDIKLLCTVRKYAIDLIAQKFGLSDHHFQVIDIPILNDDNLEQVKNVFPELAGVLKNEAINKLVRSPKYLDFVLKSSKRDGSDLSNITLIRFKEILWNSLVKNLTNRTRGLPAKREDAFMQIAINRAKEMKLFVKPVDVDEEAIDFLESDEIIVQENLNRKYTPAHDILEDWALVKFIAAKYEEFPLPNNLFPQLGSEPAIRRAFRLWIEDFLVDDRSKILTFIQAVVDDSTIENYWADEVLVAVFKSESSQPFFNSFEVRLIEMNAAFLNRCIHLIRTACKESRPETINTNILLPIGSGWKEIILFISENIQRLSHIRLSIISLLNDWHLQFYFISAITTEEKAAVKKVLLHFISEILNEDDFWDESVMEDGVNTVIQILFDLSDIAKTECENIINDALASKNGSRRDRRSKDFYSLVINNCLSGIGNLKIVHSLPKSIIQVMWSAWKLIIPKPQPGENPIFRSLQRYQLSNDQCWGIDDRFEFFPAGIFKTPILNLLNSHAIDGLKFVVDFLNYSIDFYAKADCEYKHDLKQIEIQLLDKTTVKQWAGWELWGAYRGITVTHYCIECILMSLENFMLQTAAHRSDTSRANIKFMFDYLLRNSNNVTVAAVLSSVAVAYPEEVGEAMLPILGVREFYSWDISRETQESAAMSPLDDRISYAQEERHKSNKLPHRQKFYNGLQGFLVDYQFNVRVINDLLFNLFDQLKGKLDETDIVWKKNLMEMDSRNWKAEYSDENKNSIIIRPEYDEEVTTFMNSDKDYFDAQNTALMNGGLLHKVLNNETAITFNEWVVIYELYAYQENANMLYDRPASLSVIGLTNFIADVDAEQKEWCVDTLIDIIITILQDTFNRSYELNFSYNSMEKETTLTSFHLIYPNIDDANRSELMATLICVLIAPFTEYEVRYITEYCRETFFKHIPRETKRIWTGLIKYAKFRKENPNFHYHVGNEQKAERDLKQQNLIQELATTNDFDVELSEIGFSTHEWYILVITLMITPFNDDDRRYFDFTKHIVPVIMADLELESNYSYNRKADERQIRPKQETDIRNYIIHLFLYAPFDRSKDVLGLMLTPVLQYESNSFYYRRHDPYLFCSQTFESLVYELDNIIANSSDQTLNTVLIENFWKIWEYLFNWMKTNNSRHFVKTLLLDISWKGDATNWKPLVGKKELYHQMVLEFGAGNTKSIVKFFSTVGSTVFLPEGLSWIVKVIKDYPNDVISLINPYGERLIKRLFLNSISLIKNDNQLISDFLLLLNKMIDLGSSQAYFYRENVITYKIAN